MKLTRESYHSSPKLSNSKLDLLLPECGGSADKFRHNLIEPPDETSSKERRLGTLAHLFLEKRTMDVFEVAKIPAPGIAAICEAFSRNPGTDPSKMEQRILEIAREQDYQRNWKDATVVNKILEEGGKYMLQLKDAIGSGKVLIDQEEMDALKEISKKIEICFPSIFLGTGRFDKTLQEEVIEFEIYESESKQIIECKALLDVVYFDDLNKEIHIIDLKTTSIPLSKYAGYSIIKVSRGSLVSVDVEGEMYRRNVNRQLAFYKLAAMKKWGEEYTIRDLQVAAVETKPPYECRVINIPDIYIKQGETRYNTAISMITANNLIPVEQSL